MVQVLVSTLLVVGLVAPRTFYRAGDDTGAPGDTSPVDTAPADSGTGTDTGLPADTAAADTADSGLDEGPLWGASALSGEPGGCGCASVAWGGGGASPLRNASPRVAPAWQAYAALAFGVTGLAVARRRRG
jgi:hypothetical protein